MKQTEKNEPSPLRSGKKTESFDLWGNEDRVKFAMWSNIRYDFELIAELTRYRKSTSQCLELLDTVNKYLKGTSEKEFFDGTVKCLKFLVKSNYLNISDLPTLTHDEKYLVELLNKYAHRLDLMDIFADIEEPVLRGLLLEYPNLLEEVLKDDLGRYLIGKAVSKNNITDLDEFIARVDPGIDFIEVDKDKYSKEAMRCKLIYLGLRLNNGKLKIAATAKGLVDGFSSLTDETIESETYEKGMFNSIYAAMYGSDEWGQDRKTHLTGCDALNLDFQLLSMPDNHMSVIHDLFLKEEVDKIGRKYFGEEYHPEGFIASLAIKMAIVIVLFRAENFLPKGEEQGTDIFSAGAMLGTLNYAIEETPDKQPPFRLKKWFLDYFRQEMEKRIAFIKLQVDSGVAIYRMRDIIRVVYIPVFESFRFFCSKQGLVEQTIELLKNQSIPNDIKDDIYINFVINIQKIITSGDITGNELYFKDAFMLLICQSFEGLSKKITLSFRASPHTKKYYEEVDLEADAFTAIMELILYFDLTKNDSFIGYLTSSLSRRVQSSSRMNKTDENTWSASAYQDDNSEIDFIESIPDAEDFVKTLDKHKDLKRMREYIETLPEKEKAAIKKLADSNEKINLSDTERRAKNRGLDKIRAMMGAS